MRTTPDRTLRLLATLPITQEAEPFAKIHAGIALALEVETVFRNYFKDKKLAAYGFETLVALSDASSGINHHPHIIAKRLEISSALLSHTLRELETTGMVECLRRQGRDRRLVDVHISETGRVFVKVALRDLNLKMRKIVQQRSSMQEGNSA